MCNFSYESYVTAALSGDKAAMNELIARFAPTVESIASAYLSKSPLTKDDLIQEGMIGLLSSVYGYSPDGGAKFKTYATTCISNRIISAVRNQLRDKHIPLNTYCNLDNLEIIDARTDPQLIVDMQDKMNIINEKIETRLSELEKNVLRLHIAGYNYSSVAEKLSVSEKAVDNALQRARKKLRDK
ncbi:MAG: sigma-70 family RNA polymerase sigma factor [Ruminococcus sp.]|nr:sigma-70 family RNA polymerase sigma factor [Candidatus Copronaster equi]